ncbi:hypothetical protein WT72_24295 [Burkholderia pseudomultivorans]|nr:hypothetical protein AI46_26690 [Burkholderia multivorans R-20526]KWI50295.1 hypothetical protein WT72_24295 [Burkholderia pseudomultivorans]
MQCSNQRREFAFLDILKLINEEGNHSTSLLSRLTNCGYQIDEIKFEIATIRAPRLSIDINLELYVLIFYLRGLCEAGQNSSGPLYRIVREAFDSMLSIQFDQGSTECWT